MARGIALQNLQLGGSRQANLEQRDSIGLPRDLDGHEPGLGDSKQGGSRDDFNVHGAGSGMTGMVAALKAIEMGKKTILVSHGASTMQVMSGCIDRSGDDRNPWPALRELVSSNPAHPYALLTEEEIREALSFFAVQMKESCPYHYQKGFTNFRIPTVFGEEHSTCLLPEGQFAGQLAAVNPELRVLVVGLKGYPDFSAELMVEGMKKGVIKDGRQQSLIWALCRCQMN